MVFIRTTMQEALRLGAPDPDHAGRSGRQSGRADEVVGAPADDYVREVVRTLHARTGSRCAGGRPATRRREGRPELGRDVIARDAARVGSRERAVRVVQGENC